ncbi:chemotaxis methyl-accepting protein methylase/mannose-6-phosphate isomerase-like protein (cupin superfamily) [Silvibacterium bohemicum]|uniref:Chemotaxis methyl-accepting protein methylase/mannose-6-phosphate isomerase-like protein (Cupin superfamily) n=1 Tax=Silvibacterium bohemicum TaxID=1577686 RepID=A0A841JNC0_9BACT|nr:chemotaxis methyl-accepting protein methylase/mannose-6-phosphate isomerase-like protein (cupin superfamily) [Silvibacterium bohemicum]
MRNAPSNESTPYTYTRPTSATFTGKGLLGYSFGPLNQKDLEIYYVEVEKGHDTFMVSRKIARTYYVLAGSGYFTIDNRKYDVIPGVLVEVPPQVEYCYSGKMTLLILSKPRWFSGNDTHTRWNPDVLVREGPYGVDHSSWTTKLVRAKILGKSPTSFFLRLNERLWRRLPSSLAGLRPMLSYGALVNTLARMHRVRAQALSTYFLRNRPELEQIRRLLETKGKGETLRVAVLACSTGAAAYSVAWTIRSARPDLKLILHAVDISRQAVEFAEQGVYSRTRPELTNTDIFDRVHAAEMDELFLQNGDVVSVKPWIKDGITWHVGDAGEPEMLDILGPQDIVVANNFICHMDPFEAENCLRNIARMINPGGHLFVSGIDLDVRVKVARDLKWQPVQELLEEIHDGDSSCKVCWPCHYGGLEPLNKRRADWKIRYASVFQVGSIPPAQSMRNDENAQITETLYDTEPNCLTPSN